MDQYTHIDTIYKYIKNTLCLLDAKVQISLHSKHTAAMRPSDKHIHIQDTEPRTRSNDSTTSHIYTLNGPRDAALHKLSSNKSLNSVIWSSDSNFSLRSHSRQHSRSNTSKSYVNMTPVKKQYVLNEQIYLKLLKNAIPDDNYYTRRIKPLGKDWILNDSTEYQYDQDDQLGMSVSSTDDWKNELLNSVPTSPIASSSNWRSSINWTNNADTTEKKRHAKDSIFKIDENLLVEKLDWLKLTSQASYTGDHKLRQTFLEQLKQKNTLNLDTLSRLDDMKDRLYWQSILTTVLNGDIVHNEKIKIAKQVKNPNFTKKYADDIWLDLKSWLTGKTSEEMIKNYKLLRDSTDVLVNEILDLTIPTDVINDTIALENFLQSLIDRLEYAREYWPSWAAMYKDKPMMSTPAFILKTETMTSWLNLTQNFRLLIKNIEEQVGDVHGSNLDNGSINMNTSPRLQTLVERLIKEKDIETIFHRKLLLPLSPWLIKCQLYYLKYGTLSKELNLQLPHHDIAILLLLPLRLIKLIILTRISYAEKLKNPTLMMIDQMIDDFISYIRLATQLKCSYLQFCENWPFAITLDRQFDKVVLKCIKSFFHVLQLKILYHSENNFTFSKGIDTLLKYWDELKNVGEFIDNSGILIAKGFTIIIRRILNKLNLYLSKQQNTPPNFSTLKDADKWIVNVFEILGSMKKRINRFGNVLNKAFQNCVKYQVLNYDQLFKHLINTNHFLLYTGGEIELQGIYIVGSEQLIDCDEQDIKDILNNKDIGSDLIPDLGVISNLMLYSQDSVKLDKIDLLSYEEKMAGSFLSNKNKLMQNFSSRNNSVFTSKRFVYDNDAEDEEGNNGNSDPNNEQHFNKLRAKLQSLGYLLILKPREPLIWNGDIINFFQDKPLKLKNLRVDVEYDDMILINQGSSYALDYQNDQFDNLQSVKFIQKYCSYLPVEIDLKLIDESYFQLTFNLLANYDKLVTTFKKMNPKNDMLNSVFLFCRDFACNFLKTNVTTEIKKATIISLLIKLVIDWLTFLVEDCDPTDLKTFKWCVPAMEFTTKLIDGWNIATFNEQQFVQLKKLMSRCMSLLIAHFDVMGARSMDTEENGKQLRSNNIEMVPNIDNTHDISQLNSEIRMNVINGLESERCKNKNGLRLGKVIDDTVQSNKYIVSLAKSLSNVSIRWRKRKFIGSGSFGNVFSAINLDTGELLAVKEFKIPDVNTMEKIYPLIKEEMSALEVLNHPNIVHYYGIEVHRNKVNIFMEYCEGGSLASLLKHGRIEDEMVTQIYSLELLEGLAYLHQSGVVHRDIKPENILLDYNGVIKYVDFGASIKTARQTSPVVSSNNSYNNNYNIDNSQDYHSDSSSNAKEPNSVKETHTVNEDTTTIKISSSAQGMIGTPMYMSPESITGSHNRGKFGADDVWSLGCVILEMITGKRPWWNLDNEWAIMYNVAAGHTPQLPAESEVSHDGTLFLKRILICDPCARATALELLMDPWIVSIKEIAFGSLDESD